VFSKRASRIFGITIKILWWTVLECITILKVLGDVLDDVFPGIRPTIQLTFVYLFAFLDLVFNMCRIIDLFEGKLPNFILNLLENDTLKFFFSEQIVFIMFYLVLQFFIITNPLKFNKVVRFNILLVVSLLQLQFLCWSVWEGIYCPSFPEVTADLLWTNELDDFNELASIFYFTMVLFCYLGTFGYCYFCSLTGRFPRFPKYFTWIPDSVAFWLRIRTPTMPYGKRKKGPDGKKR